MDIGILWGLLPHFSSSLLWTGTISATRPGRIAQYFPFCTMSLYHSSLVPPHRNSLPPLSHNLNQTHSDIIGPRFAPTLSSSRPAEIYSPSHYGKQWKSLENSHGANQVPHKLKPDNTPEPTFAASESVTENMEIILNTTIYSRDCADIGKQTRP